MFGPFMSSCRPSVSTRPSFITQRNHRIDSRGTSGGEVAREQRHDPEYRRHANVRQRVIRAHAGNEIAHEARDGQRQHNPRGDSARNNPHALAKNHAQDGTLCCSHGHANADFIRPLADGERNDAEHADERENQTKTTEDSRQRRCQFEKQKPVEGVEAFQHSVDIEDRHGWSKGSDLRLASLDRGRVSETRLSARCFWRSWPSRIGPGGIEVLDSDDARFAAALLFANHTLKRALTDPRIFSGIGNAYSDEILFEAKLSPLALTQKLAIAEVHRLFDATRVTLTRSTDRLRGEAGGKFPGNVTAFRERMAVHGRCKQPCPRCGTKIQRIRYASDETNYCPTCQTGGNLLADGHFRGCSAQTGRARSTNSKCLSNEIR